MSAALPVRILGEEADAQPVAWISLNTLTNYERIERLPVQSLQPGVYMHTPLYAAPVAPVPAVPRSKFNRNDIYIGERAGPLVTQHPNGDMDFVIEDYILIAKELVLDPNALHALISPPKHAALAPVPEPTERVAVSGAVIGYMTEFGRHRLTPTDWQAIWHPDERPAGATIPVYATPPQQATPSAAASIKPDVQGDALDAARYRSLRDAGPDEGPCVMEHLQNDWGKWKYWPLTGAELDAAIDAARAALKEAPGGGQ